MTSAISYVHGASDKPLIGLTIGAYFDAIAERFAGHEALVVRHQAVRWTYRELQRQVNTLACGLLRLGLHKGDRIGIWSPNNSEWVLMQFATAKAGLVLVNINPAYRRSELQYVLAKVGCKALVMAPRFRASDYVDILKSIIPELNTYIRKPINTPLLPELKQVVQLGDDEVPGLLNFSSLMTPPTPDELATLDVLSAALQFDDAINIQFTSGTTGAPKGATLTHHNILNNGYFVGEAMKLTQHDRLCIPVPLYHCFGMVLGNLACITHGAAMIFPDEAFDAATVLLAVEEERCTALHGVPTMFIAMLAHEDFAKTNLSTLRTGIMAGSPCPIEVMRQVVAKMNMQQVTIAYGMTETAPVSFQSGTDDPLERRVATVGRIMPHTEVKLVDSEGRIVPRGEKGELLTRGYCVMLGYWGDTERTAEAIDAAGWMHTGDLGTIDEEGYCNIVGRAKDMVIRGGENIYPREVEEFLYSHPKVADVQCVGVPDAKYVEELCACIILKPGVSADEEEIRAFCKGQIAHYKVPRYVQFVQSYPMTVTGKIQKFLLREQVAQSLGLAEVKTA